MATTGEKFPTAGASVSEAPWSDDSWNTPGNVVADDGSTGNVIAATFDTGDQTWVLKATGFDFSAIPDGSTIVGVTARINAWFRAGQGTGSLDLCQLLNTSGAKVGTNQCATPVVLTSTTTTIITKGSTSDLWGNALTAAWVKNANFGIALGCISTAANSDVDIDYVTLEIEYTPPATLNQAGFIGRNDDGTLVTATAKAAENTGWTQDVAQVFRVRFVVDETAGVAPGGQQFYQLQRNLNGGGWVDVNATSTVVQSAASAVVANGTATARLLTSGTGTFNAGEFDSNNGLGTGNTPVAGGLTEVEYCAQILAADVVNNDSIQLRVRHGASSTPASVALDAYSQTPTVTVNEGATTVDLTGTAAYTSYAQTATLDIPTTALTGVASYTGYSQTAILLDEGVVTWETGDPARFVEKVFTNLSSIDPELTVVGGNGKIEAVAGSLVATSNARHGLILSEGVERENAHGLVEVIGPTLWNANGTKPQHGLILRYQEDATRRRAVVIWHDIVFLAPWVLNIGVWSSDLAGLDTTTKTRGAVVITTNLMREITVSAAARASNTVTVTTATAHGLVAGDRFSIDLSDNTYDGPFIVGTVPDTTHLTYTQTAADDVAGGTGVLRTFWPYWLEANLYGPRINVRWWRSDSSPPAWDDPAGSYSADLDTIATAQDLIDNPTPTGSGLAGLVSAHLGTDDAAYQLYGDLQTDTLGPGANAGYYGYTQTGVLTTGPVDLTGTADYTGYSQTAALTVEGGVTTVELSGSAAYTGYSQTATLEQTVTLTGNATYTGYSQTAALDIPTTDLTGSAAYTGYSQAGAIEIPTVALSGAADYTGYAQSAALDIPTTALTGDASYSYTGAGTLDIPTVALTGSASYSYTATAAATVSDVELAGTAASTYTGTATLSVEGVTTIDLTGSLSVVYSQSATLDIPTTELAGSASYDYTATATLSLLVDLTGVASYTFAAVAVLEVEVVAVAGSASYTYTATGALTVFAPIGPIYVPPPIEVSFHDDATVTVTDRAATVDLYDPAATAALVDSDSRVALVDPAKVSVTDPSSAVTVSDPSTVIYWEDS